jgi:hypothetical protein
MLGLDFAQLALRPGSTQLGKSLWPSKKWHEVVVWQFVPARDKDATNGMLLVPCRTHVIPTKLKIRVSGRDFWRVDEFEPYVSKNHYHITGTWPSSQAGECLVRRGVLLPMRRIGRT